MAGIGIGSDGLYHQISDEAIRTTGVSMRDIEKLYSITPEIIKEIKDLQ
jgi:hypothetical protein